MAWSAIALSYVISWPLIALLGIAAVHYGNAAILVVGGPVAYGLSHLVFMLGMYLAGAKSRLDLPALGCSPRHDPAHGTVSATPADPSARGCCDGGRPR